MSILSRQNGKTENRETGKKREKKRRKTKQTDANTLFFSFKYGHY